MQIIIQVIIAVTTLLALVYIITKMEAKMEKEENTNNYEYNSENYQYNQSYTGGITTEEEVEKLYKEEILNQIRSINVNLIEIQCQLDRLKKDTDNIRFNTSFVAIVIFLTIAINIIIILFGVKGISEIFRIL